MALFIAALVGSLVAESFEDWLGTRRDLLRFYGIFFFIKTTTHFLKRIGLFIKIINNQQSDFKIFLFLHHLVRAGVWSMLFAITFSTIGLSIFLFKAAKLVRFCLFKQKSVFSNFLKLFHLIVILELKFNGYIGMSIYLFCANLSLTNSWRHLDHYNIVQKKNYVTCCQCIFLKNFFKMYNILMSIYKLPPNWKFKGIKFQLRILISLESDSKNNCMQSLYGQKTLMMLTIS